MADAPSSAYRKAQEAFVSNHTGTTMGEILLVTIPLPLALWTYAEIKALRQVFALPAPGLLPGLVYEFLLLLLPQVMAQTHPHLTPGILACLGGIGLFCRVCSLLAKDLPLRAKWRLDRAAALSGGSTGTSRRRNYLTNYRAGVMVTSAIAILAVDFPVFPRRFAKTESFGTGLMDLGVGCFMFANGLTSRFARTPPLPAQARANGRSGRLRTPLQAMKLLRQVAPLLVLGGGRLATHALLGYQHHVSEYGVHWNFFLTLACVHVIATLLHALLPPKALLPLSLVAMVIYQMQLSLNGLAAYVLEAPRDRSSFYSMNREGLLGVTAYLLLYVLGEQVGCWFLWPAAPPVPPAPTASGSSGTAAQLLLTPRSGAEAAGRRLLLQLCLVCGVLWAGALACASLVQPVSRRLCNLSYVLWAAAHNVMMLALLVGVDLLASIPATTQVLSAINRNQLLFFVLANLMTGAVNLSMRTLYAPTSTALTVLLGYILSLALVFLLLDKVFDVTIRPSAIAWRKTRWSD